MRYSVLVVGVVAVLAGCSLAGPAPSDGTSVQYNVTNLDSSPATVEIYVANGSVDALELRDTNGTTQSVTPPYIGEPGESRSAILELNVSTVTVAGGEVQKLLQVAPGDSATGEVTVPPGATVVVVGRVDGTVVAAGLLQCGTDEQMNQVAFVVGGYGPLIGGGCQGT